MSIEWYAVHTLVGQEEKAKANLEKRIKAFGLQDKIFQVLIPTEEVVELREGARRRWSGRSSSRATSSSRWTWGTRRSPTRPGRWCAARPASRASSGRGCVPFPFLPTRCGTSSRSPGFGKKEAPKAQVAFREGDQVRVVSGPFADFTGTVTEINPERGKVKVMVTIFGRETPVELDFSQVVKA